MNALNAHIRQTTLECSAEREIRLYDRADRFCKVALIASAFTAVSLLIAGVAYAASGPNEIAP